MLTLATSFFATQLGVVIDLKEKVARSSVMSPVVVSFLKLNISLFYNLLIDIVLLLRVQNHLPVMNLQTLR